MRGHRSHIPAQTSGHDEYPYRPTPYRITPYRPTSYCPTLHVRMALPHTHRPKVQSGVAAAGHDGVEHPRPIKMQRKTLGAAEGADL